jgi:hypothetical protein
MLKGEDLVFGTRMFSGLSLSPRYRLDDLSPWLQGIDPLRRYWLNANGDAGAVRRLPGLQPADFNAFRQAIRRFRGMVPGEQLSLPASLGASLTIHCVAENCYAIADDSPAAPVWHLFDHEALESLLMTAHPDWQCAPEHLSLGRSLLAYAWQQPTVMKAA